MRMPRFTRGGAVVALAAAVFAIAAATPVQGRPVSPPAGMDGAVSAQADPGGNGSLPLVMECFRLANGDDPNATVLLTTDNFGNDLVQVRKARAYCESAVKFHKGKGYGNTIEHGFACYSVQKGNVINDPYLLTTQNFGPDKVIVRQLVMMCESAVKRRLDTAAGQHPPYGSIDPTHVLACYSLANGDDPNAPVVLQTNNFKDDEVLVRRAFMMCEEARKAHPVEGQVKVFGKPTGLVWECYELEKGIQQQVPAYLLTNNFGADQTVITTGIAMCERARKTPLFHHVEDGTEPAGPAFAAD